MEAVSEMELDPIDRQIKILMKHAVDHKSDIGKLSNKLDAMEKSVNERFDAIDKRFDELMNFLKEG